MLNKSCALVVISFMILALCCSSGFAAWKKNGVAVCRAEQHQGNHKIAPDGENGLVVIWQDVRSGTNLDIYGGRVHQDGLSDEWGIPLCTLEGDQIAPELIPDGTGGGIGVWLDDRNRDWNFDIYAQRVDGMGVEHWTPGGLAIRIEANSSDYLQIVSDGAGGAIIAWSDQRRGESDIYAQRVSADGDILWQQNGIPVDTNAGYAGYTCMIPDGAGGAIITWTDTRNGSLDLYAQRIDGNGNILWGSEAILIGRGSEAWISRPKLMASSDGAAIAAWQSYYYGGNNIYLQKIDINGNLLWAQEGVAVCEWSGNRYAPAIADDGDGGAIVVYYEEWAYPINAQRIASDGTRAWGDCGIEVFSIESEGYPVIVSDGSGGAIVSISGYPDEEGSYTDIIAQRLDHNGNRLWKSTGMFVCNAPENQYEPLIASDGRGGAIVAWLDDRVPENASDIYCQRIGPSGLWGDPAPVILLCQDIPADQGGWLRITSRSSPLDVPGEEEGIAGYNVWRAIESGGYMASSQSFYALNVSTLERSLLDPSTAIGIRVSGSESIALGLPEGDWESVGFWFATCDTIYKVAVPTKNDSTGAGTAEETYIITAHTRTPGVFVASAPVTGYSVDNLAPPPTPGLAGTEMESPHGLQITWQPNSAPDIWKYDIHRGNDELFVPDESNRIGSTSSTGFFDGSWVWAYQYFYKLVAVDRHGNRGPAAILKPQDINVGTLLASFSASLSGSIVKISWVLTEANENARFSILRSKDGGNFEELEGIAIERSGLDFSASDATVEPSARYKYRVVLVETPGERVLFETEEISTPAMPLTLFQNHPNPFNPSTTISYYLPEPSVVTLDIYDISGKLVSRLLDRKSQEKGSHSVQWHGVDNRGKALSSGVYIYRLTCGKETIAKKMILLR